MIKPNAMEDSVQQLQGHFQSQPVPPPPQNINFQELAAKQIRELGPSMDPALSQLATVMATMQLKSEYEIKLSSHLLHKTLLDTVNSVKQNSLDISDLKSSVWQTVQTCQQVQQQQGQSLSQLSQVHETSVKAYDIAAETKQKCSKGNFIVSGEGIPRQSENENLYTLIFPLIYRKYGIHIHPNELKALHRLPNNKVLFSLIARMPGRSFDQLTYAMNSNPRPEVKVYVSIQLFEPFAELYYTARRSKHYKLISNYRLDENGNTQIALQVDTMSFKFTGLDQLKALNVQVPAQIYQEVAYRRNQIRENEARSVAQNNEKAFKKRPNFVPEQNRSNHQFYPTSHQQTYNQGYQYQNIQAQGTQINVQQTNGTPALNNHSTGVYTGTPGPVFHPPSVIQPTGKGRLSGAVVQAPQQGHHQVLAPSQRPGHDMQAGPHPAALGQHPPAHHGYPPSYLGNPDIPPPSQAQAVQAGGRGGQNARGAEQPLHESLDMSFYQQANYPVISTGGTVDKNF